VSSSVWGRAGASIRSDGKGCLFDLKSLSTLDGFRFGPKGVMEGAYITI
jgi:hypothetical protein